MQIGTKTTHVDKMTCKDGKPYERNEASRIMSYQTNKTEVLDFFDKYIIRYVVKDLEILDNIRADTFGAGACTIPQAISTFAALDLIGYLIHTQEIKTVGMSFTEFINNDIFFPEIKQYSSYANFFEFFRDNLRSFMVHRFSLVKYDITKSTMEHLFFEENGRQIFNASKFTRMSVYSIQKVYNELKNESFIINGYSKEKTMKIIKERIEKLQDFKGILFKPEFNLPISTITTKTTSSIGST